MISTYASGHLPLDAGVNLRLLPDLAQLAEGLELSGGLRQPSAPGLHGQPERLLGAGGELEAGRGPGREAELRLKRGVASRSWTLGSLPVFRTSGERMLSRTEPERL